jgi:enolase-phosphatase E1
VKVVLLDIEGTTTPISFVHDVLFPYARAGMTGFLRAHVTGLEIQRAARLLHNEHGDLVARGESPPGWHAGTNDSLLQSIANFGNWLMDRDVKSPGLKLLQGLIWEEGYRDGTIRGEVFPDVPAALQRWRDAGMVAAIYSSGSVLAQRLLFGHTAYGDLTPFISAWFDTAVGGKRDAGSYARIVAELELNAQPNTVLFVSDVVPELDAAIAAGLQAALCVRPGNAPASAPHGALTVASLDAL